MAKTMRRAPTSSSERRRTGGVTSAGTHAADGDVDLLRLVRDNLGHASTAPTNLYLHTNEEPRSGTVRPRKSTA